MALERKSGANEAMGILNQIGDYSEIQIMLRERGRGMGMGTGMGIGMGIGTGMGNQEWAVESGSISIDRA